MYLHNTIRKYTLALLNFFNEITVQHLDSKGCLITKKVPVTYRNKEKNELMDKSFMQEIQGNLSILPRGTLVLTQMSKSSDRNTSKYNKMAFYRETKDLSYMWQPVPYDFTFDMSFICRGMNEACQIIEEIAPKFNPNIAIDIYDADNLNEPTRIPVQLQDINPEFLGFEEYSMNVIRVSCILTVNGWLYPPIKNSKKITNLDMQYKTPKRDNIILNFDVIDGETSKIPTVTETYRDDVLYINAKDLVFKDNIITCIYETNSKETPKFEFYINDDRYNIDKYITAIKGNKCKIIDGLNSFKITCILKLNNEMSIIERTINTVSRPEEVKTGQTKDLAEQIEIV